MSERLQSNKEEFSDNAVELEGANLENRERISEELAEKAEKSPDRKNEQKQALHEALDRAETKNNKEEQPTVERPPADEPIKTLSQKNLDIRFNQTLEHVRKDMKPASRAFSKVIHNPVIDKTSEVIGRTVARPNLILAGGIGTLTLGLAIYLVAKHYGYVLSGFESIGSFVIGWAIGIIIEFIRVGFKNRRSM